MARANLPAEFHHRRFYYDDVRSRAVDIAGYRFRISWIVRHARTPEMPIRRSAEERIRLERETRSTQRDGSLGGGGGKEKRKNLPKTIRSSEHWRVNLSDYSKARVIRYLPRISSFN